MQQNNNLIEGLAKMKMVNYPVLVAGNLIVSKLPPRMGQAVAHIAHGRTDGEIGILMSVTKGTAHTYRAGFLYRVKARNSAQAIMNGFELGILKLVGVKVYEEQRSKKVDGGSEK